VRRAKRKKSIKDAINRIFNAFFIRQLVNYFLFCDTTDAKAVRLAEAVFVTGIHVAVVEVQEVRVVCIIARTAPIVAAATNIAQRTTAGAAVARSREEYSGSTSSISNNNTANV
jgi:hypothetical protein